jgi:hypothetical protein
MTSPTPTPGNTQPSAGPNAQGNTYAPGTVGQAPTGNPTNPQDRTSQPNPQDLNSTTGRNPQDMRSPTGNPPSIIKPEPR